MPTSQSYLEYIVNEIFRDILGITTRRMFSGYGVYKDGVIFALILNDALYFKTDEINRQKFIDAGSTPFSYMHKTGKKVVTSYWELPERIIEDKIALPVWIADALKSSTIKKAGK